MKELSLQKETETRNTMEATTEYQFTKNEDLLIFPPNLPSSDNKDMFLSSHKKHKKEIYIGGQTTILTGI